MPSNTTHVTWEAINPEEWRRQQADGASGASVEFLGIVRGREDGRPIAALEYEAYAPMAERVIARLVEQARAQWPLHQMCVRHRVGHVPVGEIALLIGVTAPHREEAFEACQFLIDAIKRDAPIWKSARAASDKAIEVGSAC